MTKAVLSLVPLTPLLLVATSDVRTLAESPDRGPEHAAADPTRVGNVARWEKLIRHSVDFFERHAFDEKSGSYYSEIRNDGTVASEVRHIVATGRMLYALAHASRIDPKYKARVPSLKPYILRAMTAKEDKVGPYFRTAVNDAGKDVAKRWNKERMMDEWVNEPLANLAINEQAYGLCGLVALYSVEPTAEALEEIAAFYAAFRERFKDKGKGQKGFLDEYRIPADGKPGAANDIKT